MKSAKLMICVICALFAAINPARTQALLAGDFVAATVEHLICAERDLYFGAVGFGRRSAPADRPWR